MELLFTLYGDPVAEQELGETATIQGWLDVEAALAGALADAGVIAAGEAASIGDACRIEHVDRDRLWEETRVVGYPILPLVRMICDRLPPWVAGLVHWGATTQDIMDTALAGQVSAVLRRLWSLAAGFGDALAVLVAAHQATVMAGRTHGQQAVPTTFGAKCAVLLDQVGRDLVRLERADESVRIVSLFGAGGTSAALDDAADAVRASLARRLDLAEVRVPWHVARDGLAEAGQVAVLASGTAVRFAREVIDLSRTEVGELAEADGEYRGASSAMPQKANPISAEAIVGFGVAAATMSGALLRALEAGHERAAGEWQAEWQALPYVLRSSAGALRMAGILARELRVSADRMRENLRLDHGLILAEAYMTRLARTLGRDRAHEVVYQAARRSRLEGRPLAQTLADAVGDEMVRGIGSEQIVPEQYLGSVPAICKEALAQWEARRGLRASASRNEEAQ